MIPRADRRGTPVALLVAAITLLPVLAVAGTLFWVMSDASRRIAQDMGDRMMTAASEDVRGKVASFLADARRVSDRFVRRIESGQLDLDNLSTWRHAMLDELVVLPHLGAVTFGNESGRSLYVQIGTNRFEMGDASGPGPGECVEYEIKSDGSVVEPPLRTYQYDARGRPWYLAAKAASEPIWTPIYFWFGANGSDVFTGTGYTRLIHRDGSVIGSLVVDITLAQLSHFLTQMPLSDAGYVFLIDDQGYLVATSHGPVNSGAGERIKLGSSANLAAIEIARRIGKDATLRQFVLDLEGKPHRVQITPASTEPGLAWRVIVVLPESVFMGEVEAVQRNAALIASIILAGGAFFAWRLSRRITLPMQGLASHVDRIATGDLETRLDLKGSREFVNLSSHLNQMSVDLKSRLELMQSLRLATEVQQSLLPRTNPVVPGLDIYGTSKYCDQTGGDYFDYVDVASTPEGDLFVAIGDVMGHGIGSAMLMAAARGALRAVLLDIESLSDVMKRVNNVLVQSDAGLFMTMTLMRIDPASRSAEWASGGHDGAIIYNPADDSFRELDGAEPPLGLVADMEFGLYRAEGLVTPMVMILGTDGIWELRNEQGEEYGKERMSQLIKQHASTPAAEIGRELEADLERFRGSAPVRDDITFVVIRFV
jgi:serine phosphatase RsbU (regulator of sigma subunit)